MVIWKYELSITDRQNIQLPVGAQILSVQMQNGNCCMWVMCNSEAPLETRRFAMYGTGHELPQFPGKYITTFQFDILVFHLFESPIGLIQEHKPCGLFD
jgi:hypothetical protein